MDTPEITTTSEPGFKMRGLRSTGIMLVLFLALGSYAYFIESERPPASETDVNEQALDVEQSAIVSLSVTTRNGDDTSLNRDGEEDWTVVEPFMATADNNAVSAIVESLASLEIRRVVEETPSDLSPFGLVQPTVSIGFSTENNSASLTLAVGDETPTGADRYATLTGSDRVFLIASAVETTFNKDSFELRDRSLLEFIGPDVIGFSVENNKAETRFEKTDGNWRIVSPLNARADFGVVEGLVGRVGSAEMVSVERESYDTDEEIEPFGLANPGMTVTVDAGNSKHALLVGTEGPDGTVFGRDESRDVIFTIDAALVDDLNREPSAYRKQELFDFQPFNATAISVLRDGTETNFEKNSPQDEESSGETWQQVAPESEDTDQAAVEVLLSTLSTLRAESFVPTQVDTGIDTPLAVVTVSFGEGQEERVTIGRMGETTYAIHGSEPGAAVIDSASIDSALEALSTATP